MAKQRHKGGKTEQWEQIKIKLNHTAKWNKWFCGLVTMTRSQRIKIVISVTWLSIEQHIFNETVFNDVMFCLTPQTKSQAGPTKSMKQVHCNLSCLVTESPRKEVMPLKREDSAIMDEGRCVFHRLFCWGCYQRSGKSCYKSRMRQSQTNRNSKGQKLSVKTSWYPTSFITWLTIITVGAVGIQLTIIVIIN